MQHGDLILQTLQHRDLLLQQPNETLVAARHQRRTKLLRRPASFALA
jgi:hypothetical protein